MDTNLHESKELSAVPVLAEPETDKTTPKIVSETGGGEARESTQQKATVGDATTVAETRDGRQNSSGNGAQREPATSGRIDRFHATPANPPKRGRGRPLSDNPSKDALRMRKVYEKRRKQGRSKVRSVMQSVLRRKLFGYKDRGEILISPAAMRVAYRNFWKKRGYRDDEIPCGWEDVDFSSAPN